MKQVNIYDIWEAIKGTKTHSKWDAGVKQYALDLLEDEIEIDAVFTGYAWAAELERALLNGAADWREYSYGYVGCDIAERLCTPTELKRTNNGEKQPISKETWLDVQTRALIQAWYLIAGTFWTLKQNGGDA